MGKFAVVTGDSRGLGKAVSSLFLESGIGVIGLSRNRNLELEEIAEENHCFYKHLPMDLANIQSIEENFPAIADTLLEQEATTVYLINNAASVEPIERAENVKQTDLLRHFQLNAVAPMTLTNLLLKFASEKGMLLRIAMITSGAAVRPTSGWSAYCSSKASINMYTQTVALEQDETNTGHKIIAFSPGIMDTEMQAVIRSSSASAFSGVKTFQQYKENNALRNPALIASVLIDILFDEGMVNGKIYDVKNYV